VDILDRKLQILDERDYFSSIERTRNAVDRLLPTVRAARDPALRDIYVAKMADKTGVRRETLEAELAKEDQRHHTPMPVVPSQPRTSASYRLRNMGAERKVLLLMVKRRDWVERVAEHVGPEDFHDPAYRTIFEALVADPDLTRPPDGMDSGAARRLEGLLADPEELSHAERVFQDSVHRLKGGGRDQQAQELGDKLDRADTFEEEQQLLSELQALRNETTDERDWLGTARQVLGRGRRSEE
jgi:DNA primase